MALIGGMLMFGMSAQQMSQGIFLPRVAESLDVGMGSLSIAYSMASFGGLILTPILARLYNRYSAKLITCGILTCQCISLMLLSVANNLFTVAVACAFESTALSGYNNVLLALLIKRWFKDRGQLAYDVCLFLSMLGGVVFTAVAGAIIQAASWRIAYRVLAAFFLFVETPVVLFLFKESPEQIGIKPYEHPDMDKDHAIEKRPVLNRTIMSKAAWRTPDFYLATLYSIFFTYAMTMQNHLAKHLENVGFPTSTTATVMTVSMVGGLVGRVLLGYLNEKFGLKFSTALYCGIGIATAFALCGAGGMGSTLLITVSFLFGMAIRAGVTEAFQMRYRVFGASHDYILINANISICMNLINSTSGTVYGLIYDFNGSYNGGLILVAVAFALAILTACVILRNGREKAAAEDILKLENAGNN